MSGPVSFLSRVSSTSKTRRVALLRVALALGAAWLTGEAAVRIVSNFLPGVRYLSTMRVKSRPQKHPNLQSFLKAQAHLFPYRNWHNY